MLIVRLLFAPLVSFAAASAACGADRLILRNLEILTERTVVSLDEDGLVLDGPRPGGGDRVTWDEIEQGRIGLDQPRFDALLRELGLPLYRVRQRLRIGDYEALAEPAESLYPRFAERTSQTAYLVCQAVMWSRIAAGRREAAVEPLLRCYELLRSRAAAGGDLPGSRRLRVDPATAISPELLPVWIDAAAAKSALPGVEESIRAMSQPRPEGAIVYYASLALAAGETAEAERVISSLNAAEPAAAAWRDVLGAQQEVSAGSPGPAVQRLRTTGRHLPDGCRPLVLYWLGLADALVTDEAICRDGVLALLTLPAAYGSEQPELAAAGLYHAAAALDKLKDGRGAAAVRSELTGRYARTSHAARLRGELSP